MRLYLLRQLWRGLAAGSGLVAAVAAAGLAAAHPKIDVHGSSVVVLVGPLSTADRAPERFEVERPSATFWRACALAIAASAAGVGLLSVVAVHRRWGAAGAVAVGALLLAGIAVVHAAGAWSLARAELRRALLVGERRRRGLGGGGPYALPAAA